MSAQKAQDHMRSILTEHPDLVRQVLTDVLREAKDKDYNVSAAFWGASRVLILLRGETP